MFHWDIIIGCLKDTVETKKKYIIVRKNCMLINHIMKFTIQVEFWLQQQSSTCLGVQHNV